VPGGLVGKLRRVATVLGEEGLALVLDWSGQSALDALGGGESGALVVETLRQRLEDEAHSMEMRAAPPALVAHKLAAWVAAAAKRGTAATQQRHSKKASNAAAQRQGSSNKQVRLSSCGKLCTQAAAAQAMQEAANGLQL
jgi:hypothetical protein